MIDHPYNQQQVVSCSFAHLRKTVPLHQILPKKVSFESAKNDIIAQPLLVPAPCKMRSFLG
jgi:hypothetical protein